MAGDPIHVEQLGGLMDRYAQAIRNAPLQDTLKKCSPALRAGVAENWAADGSPGAPWPPRKRKKPAGQWENPLLILSGALFEAATSDFGTGHVEIYDVREMALGVDDQAIPYAATHNFGDPSRNIPQRKFMVVDEQTIADCVAICTADMYAILNGVK